MNKNKSPLHRMTEQAMAKMPPQTIHLRGKHARAFHGMKIGSKVHARMHGTLQNTGMDQYNDNEPTAEISLDSLTPHEGGAPDEQQDAQDIKRR